MSKVTFGSLVKQRRRALGLTQEALAERVSCARVTIYKIENDQRRPSLQMVERMADMLDIPTAERDTFIAEARNQIDPLPLVEAEQASAPPDPLSVDFWNQLHRPVGRELEIAQIAAHFRQRASRLLTIVGPPGVGKTRLALAVSAVLREDYPDGVVFVPLASLTDSRQILSLLANRLGLMPTPEETLRENIVAHLDRRRALIVLDNFEHLLDGAALLDDLLQRAAHVDFLVTSRSRLCLINEQRFVLAPLSLPQNASLAPEQLMRESSAVALFVKRAQAVNPDFILTPDNASAVVSLCRRLDGLPLAIEIAAGWCHVLTPHMMLEQTSRILLDTPSAHHGSVRHHTLHAAITWSVSLLPADAQALLQRLAICSNGATLELSEQLAAFADEPLETARHRLLRMISMLVDASLLSLDESSAGGLYYTMLSTVRTCAFDQLIASGISDEAFARLTDYYLQQTDGLSLEATEAAAARLTLLDFEQDNLRAALGWTQSNDPLRGLQLALASWPFWFTRGLYREGHHWVTQAIETVQNASPELRAQTLRTLSSQARLLGKLAVAHRYAVEALALYQQLADVSGQAAMLNALGNLEVRQGELAQAIGWYEQSVTLAHDYNLTGVEANALSNLGMVLVQQESFTAALQALVKSMSLRQARGDQRGIAIVLTNIGFLHYYKGEDTAACVVLKESLTICRELRDSLGIAIGLELLGRIVLNAGAIEEASMLLQESLNLFWQIQEIPGLVLTLETYAVLCLAIGDSAEASRLAGTVAEARVAHTIRLDCAEQRRAMRLKQQLEHCLAERFALFYTEGQRRSLAHTVEVARQIGRGGTPNRSRWRAK